jgi:hypothetical protein
MNTSEKGQSKQNRQRNLIRTGRTLVAALFALGLAAPVAAQTIPGLGSRGGVFASEPGFGVQRTVALPAKASKGQLSIQASLAGDAALKIFVAEEGWYRITRAEMAAAGFDPGTNPASIELYTSGVNQPILVDAGDDGRFDAWDAIEFYGIGLDTPSTGARTYWLRLGSSGLRLKAATAKGGSAFTASVPFTVEVMDRAIYAPTAVWAAQGSDVFYDSVVRTTPVTKTLHVENIDHASTASARVEVVLQGGIYDLENRVRVDVNGYPTSIVSVNPRMAAQTFQAEIPQSRLQAGANTVTLTALNGSYDVSLLLATRITYQHTLRADAGALMVPVPGLSTVTVGGFATESVRAVDVTDPMAPALLGVSTAPDGAGFAATVTTPRSKSDLTVLFVEAARFSGTPEMVVNSPSSWSGSSRTQQADLVIVTHGAFAAAAAELGAAREAEGLATRVVDVDDIYDEYAWGTRSPEAIRAFLEATKSWKRSPRFVVLLGDASSDPRDYLGTGSLDYVPTQTVRTERLRAASDAWLADFSGDGVENLAIGRLPARTSEEAALLVGKITSRGVPSGTWASSALIVSDARGTYDFPAVSAELLPLIPSSMTAQSLGFGDTATPKAALTTALNSGHLLVNYFGHGSTETIGNNVFTRADAEALQNGNQLPVAMLIACYTGNFFRPGARSLAEALVLAPEGGAVAVWAASTLTYATPEVALNREVFKQLFGTTAPAIGEAMRLAKLAVTDRDVRTSYILFGDPSLKLR